ncbi:hypothetical protein FUAX_28540 [Fulvitalea axinellae]|uniref:Uncharacterized protein n=1 Tax=Fulvitalea axinellae TaxID=1182444 RepID=A0AAU9CR24_9BACT|nr:hypothetical protein FUAX_28540 [Fulvitalea axinellae]
MRRQTLQRKRKTRNSAHGPGGTSSANFFPNSKVLQRLENYQRIADKANDKQQPIQPMLTSLGFRNLIAPGLIEFRPFFIKYPELGEVDHLLYEYAYVRDPKSEEGVRTRLELIIKMERAINRYHAKHPVAVFAASDTGLPTPTSMDVVVFKTMDEFEKEFQQLIQLTIESGFPLALPNFGRKSVAIANRRGQTDDFTLLDFSPNLGTDATLSLWNKIVYEDSDISVHDATVEPNLQVDEDTGRRFGTPVHWEEEGDSGKEEFFVTCSPTGRPAPTFLSEQSYRFYSHIARLLGTDTGYTLIDNLVKTCAETRQPANITLEKPKNPPNSTLTLGPNAVIPALRNAVTAPPPSERTELKLSLPDTNAGAMLQPIPSASASAAKYTVMPTYTWTATQLSGLLSALRGEHRRNAERAHGFGQYINPMRREVDLPPIHHVRQVYLPFHQGQSRR